MVGRLEDLRRHPQDRERNWLLVDAEGQTLGRLATQIADALRGKRKPTYTPHVDTGDFVVVVNAEKIAVTGDKRQEKMYYRHSGYPGGLKTRTLNDMLERRPEEVIRLAVRGHAPQEPPRPQAAHQAEGLRRPRAPARGAEAATDGDQDLMPPRTARVEQGEELGEPEQTEIAPRTRRRAARGRAGAPAGDRDEAAAEASEAPEPSPAAEPAAEAEAPEAAAAAEEDEDVEEVEETPRVKPEIPGIDLEVDIVREGEDSRGESRWSEDGEDEPTPRTAEDDEDLEPQPIADAAIDLAAGARYTATGKRKTAVARVILKPGTGAYVINGRTLDEYFPRPRCSARSASRSRRRLRGPDGRRRARCTAAASPPRPARCATASRAR